MRGTTWARYVHELMLTGQGTLAALRWSASVGRGFAAFGTDDPMMRPFVKYPINHHLSQVLERATAAGALRLGPAMLEASTFGGDEPTHPSALPNIRRFGDSWSVRRTLLPLERTEIQASYARVASPEEREGHGLDQRKQSVSARATTTGISTSSASSPRSSRRRCAVGWGVRHCGSNRPTGLRKTASPNRFARRTLIRT